MTEANIIDVCEIFGGKPAPKDESAFEIEGIPFVRMRDLGRYHLTTNLDTTDNKIGYTYAKTNNLKPIPKGAVLIPRSGSVALNHRAILAQDSIIVSHICALVVKDSTSLSNRFLYYWLCQFDMNKIAKKTTGLDAINFSDLGKISISYPDLDTQNKIVAILDKAQEIFDKREATIAKYDELLRATCLEMFGDIANNPKGIDKKPLKEFGEIITGNTPPRSDKSNYDTNYIEWIKTDNIISQSHILTPAIEYLSETGFANARYVNENSLLVACIAGSIGSIGRSAIANRKVTFNQQINAIVPANDVSVYFLYWMFKVSAEYVQSFATGGMKRLLTKGEFEKIPFIKPDYDDQLNFEKVALYYSDFKSKLIQHQIQSENLLKSLSQQVFSERIIIDVDAELEALINAIDLDRKEEENSIDSVINDITFIQRLIDRLNEQEFEDKDQYDKAKYVLFRIMKQEDNLVKQIFKDNKIQLTLQNETA